MPLLVRDAALVRKQKLRRNATARRRKLLRAASKALCRTKAKAKAKAKSRSQRGPTKKNKNAVLPPHGYQNWPMLLPYDMLTAIVEAGCVDRLWLGDNNPRSLRLCCFLGAAEARQHGLGALLVEGLQRGMGKAPRLENHEFPPKSQVLS